VHPSGEPVNLIQNTSEEPDEGKLRVRFSGGGLKQLPGGDGYELYSVRRNVLLKLSHHENPKRAGFIQTQDS
jgi:hypothetical protein